MLIEVSDEILEGVQLTPEQALLAFAVGLYTSGNVTLGRAAAIAGISQSDFQRELGRRGIVARCNAEDLRKDAETLASFRRSA